MTTGPRRPRGVRAGVARADITPPRGIRLNGTLRDQAAHRIDAPLSVTALALESQGTTVIIVAADMVIIGLDEARAIREAVAARVGCPVAHVYFNISHSHATPSPPSWREFDPVTEADEAELNRVYHRLLLEQVAGAAEAAVADLREARVGAGAGSVRIGINRREQLPDGTMVLGENADGIIDPAVGVVRIDAIDGAPIAVVVHHACHPDVLGPKSDLVSPDFVGSARVALERVTGATALFLQGCAGDIDPRCGIVVGDDGPLEAGRLGTELGCEAARVYQGLANARERHERVAWPSSSGAGLVTGWGYRDAAIEETAIAAAEVTLRLPLRPYPPRDEAERTLADAISARDAVLARDHSLSELLTTRRRVIWADLQLRAIIDDAPLDIDFTLHALRIGPLALLGMPAEVFVEIGLRIAEASPFPTTLVSGYTNGVLFYVPTADAHRQGGYEIESHCNYLVRSGPAPEWEDLLVGAAGRLLNELADETSGSKGTTA